jgi:beta-phosphoglucomutase-like phosphatase (HAD superfamily)
LLGLSFRGLIPTGYVIYLFLASLNTTFGYNSANVLRTLNAIGMSDFFHAVITADDHLKPKPNPDMFLESARIMGVKPELRQVFEDGDLGLEAAARAGMLAPDVRPYL